MTVPISHGIDDRLVNVDSKMELSDFVNRRLLPFLRRVREIINEQNTLVATNTGPTYEWDLDRFGTLILKQTSSTTLAISVASNVDLARLRQGRIYTLILIDNVGLTFSFSTDFDSTGVALGGATRAGTRTRLQFVVKDSALSGAPTLIALSNNANSPLRLGYGAKATGSSATALGTLTDVSGQNSVGIGTSATVSGEASAGIGAATVTGNNAFGFGNSAQATHDGSTAWGKSANTTKARQFKLGQSSTEPYEEFLMSSLVGGTFYAGDTPNRNGSFIGNNRTGTEAGCTNLGSKVGLTTTAVGGFPCVPSGAGPPTGIPTPDADMIPTYVDRDGPPYLYGFIGGAWVAL